MLYQSDFNKSSSKQIHFEIPEGTKIDLLLHNFDIYFFIIL